MKEELENLDKDLKRIKIKKIPNTFLSVINKRFDEVTISKYLAFLLDPQNTSIKIIKELLNVSSIDKDEANFSELLDNENTYFEGIETENAVSGKSRIDITIRFSTFLVVIENKINSNENKAQSIRYEKEYEDNEKPVKYICIKPKYNHTKLKNQKFANITYEQIIEILKSVTKYDLEEQDNYCFIEDFIKHVEGYFMNENQLEINEEVEFYMNNREIVDNIAESYKKQCGLVIEQLEEIIKNRFGEEFETYTSIGRGFLQIRKKNWINKGYVGVHYEILWPANKIIGDEVKIQFAIHNEGKDKKKISEIKHQVIKEESYKLNNSENIIQSLNKIADKMYEIAKENNEYIDKILNNACNKKEC